MWKKLSVIFFTLICMSSAVYAMNYKQNGELKAEEKKVKVLDIDYAKTDDSMIMLEPMGSEQGQPTSYKSMYKVIMITDKEALLLSMLGGLGPKGESSTPSVSTPNYLDSNLKKGIDFYETQYLFVPKEYYVVDSNILMPNDLGEYSSLLSINDIYDTSIPGCTVNDITTTNTLPDSCLKTDRNGNKIQFSNIDRTLNFWLREHNPTIPNTHFYYDANKKKILSGSISAKAYMNRVYRVDLDRIAYSMPWIMAHGEYGLVKDSGIYEGGPQQILGIFDDNYELTIDKNITNIKDGDVIPFTMSSAIVGKAPVRFVLKAPGGNEVEYYGKLTAIDDTHARFDFGSVEIPDGYYDLYMYSNQMDVSGVVSKSSNVTLFENVLIGDVPIFSETPEKGISYFEASFNTSTNANIGQLGKMDSVTPGVNYTLTPHSQHTSDAHANDYTNFKFEENADKSMDVLKASVNLTPGTYYFQITKYKPNSSTDKVFFSDIAINVYPSRDNIKFNVEKQIIDGNEKNYNTSDINTSTGTSKTLGTAFLDPAVSDVGEVAYGFKNTRLNGTAVASGSEDFQMDVTTGKITKKNMISYGKHEFDIVTTYTKGEQVIPITKGTYSFYVDPVIYFVDPKTPTTKITQTEIIYDEAASDHSFSLLAKSDDAPVTSAIKYRLKADDDTGILTYSGSGGKFIANKPGTTKVEAYYQENNIDVVVAELSVKIAANPIKDLSYTFTPQKDSSNIAYTYLSFQKNVARDTVIGHISSKDGAKPVTYVLSDTTNFTLKENNDTATNDTQPYVTDKDGNVLLYANKDLDIGKFDLKIQAYDSQNEPYFSEVGSDTHYGIDKDGNKVADYDKGLISTIYDIVVYPNDSQITTTQNKQSDGRYLSNVELNKDTSINLADVEFASSAKIVELASKGYVIDSATIVNKGSTTAHSELSIEADATNKSKFYIKGKGNLSSGSKEFDIIFKFKKNGSSDSTATITKAAQSIYIAPEIKFANPEKPTEFLSGDAYSRYYDPEDKTNSITMIATDNAQANTPNATVKYCVLDGEDCATTFDVIEVSDDGYGSASIKVLAPGMENKTATLRAYVEDTSKSILAKKDVEVTIQPAKQILTWEGKNIQLTGNHITKDDKAERTWKLNLKYDKDTVANNSFTMAEVIKGITTSDKTITLRDDVIAGTTTDIAYAIQCQDVNDNANIEIKEGKLNLLGELKGDVSVTATAQATGNYAKADLDDSSTTDINEDMSAKLIISVSNKAKVSFTKSYENDPKATSDEALGKAKLGELKIDPDTETGYTFAIDTVKQKDESKSTPEHEVFVDLASSKFQVKVESNKANLYANTSSPLGTGTYLVKVKATKDKEEATAKEIRITISYESMDETKLKWQSKVSDAFQDMNGNIDHDTGTNTETLKHIFIDNGAFYAKIENREGTQLENATIKYALSDDSDADIISVDDDGKITMKGASPTDAILKIKATIIKDGYEKCEVYLPILVEKGDSLFQLTNKNGTAYSLANANDKTKYSALELIYGENAPVDVFTKGAPEGSKVTIEIKDKGATKGNDVLAFKAEDTNNYVCEIAADDYPTQRLSKCQAMIKNALFDQLKDKNKIVYVASIEETMNYKAMSIELPINVIPAAQTDFDFAESELYYESNQNGVVEPVFQTKDKDHANISTGKITLLTSIDDTEPDFQEDEVWLDDSTFNPDDPEYTEGIKGFGYNIVVAENEEERIGKVYAQKEKDRNFKVSEIKTLEVHIMPEGTCQYQVTIKNYPTVGGNATKDTTYGDAYFSISAKSEIEDTADPDATYTYEIDDSSKDYLTTYGSNGNEFKPIKVNAKVKIKITRTSGTGISAKPVIKTISIKPKEVKLKVADIQKKNGMMLTSDDIKFTSDSGDFLASDKDKLHITFIAQDGSGESLIDKSDGIRMQYNNLPLKATITNKDTNIDVLSNYKIVKLDGKTVGVEDGKLTVSEDESEMNWYEIKEGSISEGLPTSKGMNDWYNGPVDIVLTSEASRYDRISENGNVWLENKYTYANEGNNDIDIYFRQSSGSEQGAIATPQSETLKIDSTKPTITSIKATITHEDAFSKLIRALTFNTFMKPGEEVTITTSDVQKNPDMEVSTTKGIEDGIKYSVYELDAEGNRIESVLENEKADTNSEGIGTFTMEEPGTYEVCTSVRDQAGNTSEVRCEPLLVKKIDIDVDGDGKDDFIDSDGDGCPDLDIVLVNKKGEQYKINIDRDEDGIPDLNIDSDKDGEADINIDSDGDKKPDINLVILSKWEPTFCVETQSDPYCTMEGIEAEINIDDDKNGVPEFNIDTKGDFAPHYNITRPGESEPYLNIGKVHTTWNPDQNYKKDDFLYDSIAYHQPLLNIDTDEDMLPDVNIDVGGDGEPDLNIDNNGDLIPDINIDGNGDGEAEYNLDPDENGKPTKEVIKIEQWEPNLNGTKDGVAFDTMEIKRKDNLEDQGVTVEKPGGSFLPNYSIKVENIKDSVSEEIKKEIEEFIDADTEIKDIIDVKLYEGDKQVQPNEAYKIKIPMKEEWKLLKNLKVVAQQADGTFKEIEVVIESDFIIFEAEYLGTVSIIGDKIEVPTPEPEPQPEPKPEEKPDVPIPDLKPNGSGGSTPNTSVKGDYTSGVGGAGTGDSTSLVKVCAMILLSGTMLLSMKRYYMKKARK